MIVNRLPVEKCWQDWFTADIWEQIQRKTTANIDEMSYSLDSRHYLM